MVTLYSRDNCVQCTATKRALTAKGIEYEEFNTSHDKIYEDKAKSYGFLQAPVVVPKDGEPWSGFDPDRISALAVKMAA